jgi:hypothetical protein
VFSLLFDGRAPAHVVLLGWGTSMTVRIIISLMSCRTVRATACVFASEAAIAASNVPCAVAIRRMVFIESTMA